MVSIDNIAFIIIIQTGIILILLSAFLFYLLRLKNKKIKTLSGKIKDVQTATSPLASVEFYLTAEIKLLEGRFDSLFTKEDLSGGEFTEADWLSLRKDFLEMEKMLLTEQDKLHMLWANIGDKVKTTLKNHHLVKRNHVKDINEDDEDDVKEMKTLLKSQYDDFESLYEELEGDKTKDEVANLKDKLRGIIRSHTELTHCIYVLEDENVFLRNQIKELAK